MASNDKPVARTARVLNNLSSSIVSRIATLLLNFVTRTLFIYFLSKTYLSLNGLYSDILNMLSLAELGFGVTMIYSMYKPMAEKDHARMSSIMRLYRSVYRVMGAVILVIGLAIIPFLQLIVKIPEDMTLGTAVFPIFGLSVRISYVTLYYVIHLVSVVLTYWFNSYRHSILNADQRSYIVTYLTLGSNIIMNVLQILVLFLFAGKNPDFAYSLYLIIAAISVLAINTLVWFVTKKLYPWLDIRHAAPLPREDVKRIAKDVGSNAVARIAHVALTGTDNIIISAMVGTLIIGSLSNYNMIPTTLAGILTMFTGALTASLGNFFVEKSKEEGLGLFENVSFANNWLYGLCVVCLVTLLNPFVTLWLHNADYLLSWPIVIALSINFFVAGFMNTLFTFRSALGLFTQGWFRPVIVAVVNIGASIGLAYVLRDVTWFGISGEEWSLFGILFATFLSRASVNLWYDPIIIHKFGFGVSSRRFFLSTLRCVVWVIVLCLVLVPVKVFLLPVTLDMPRWQQFLNFVLLVLATAVVCLGGFWIINRKQKAYSFFMNRFTGVLKGIVRKLTRR